MHLGSVVTMHVLLLKTLRKVVASEIPEEILIIFSLHRSICSVIMYESLILGFESAGRPGSCAVDIFQETYWH